MSNNKRRLRNLTLLSLSAAGAAAGAVAGARHLARRFLGRPLPRVDGELQLASLRRPVEVLRDPWGVPHIFAQTEEDLFFAQGFVHAQDRLFQMDVNRRLGLGRLSEVVGPPGLETDRFARVFGWHKAAEAQVAGILADSETRSIAEAYAAGVNAFIEQGKLPVEYSLLAFRPEPWRPLDSAAWGTVLAWGLSVNWETELLRARLVEKLGPEKAADLTPAYRDHYPTIIPGASVGARLAVALVDAYRRAVDTMPLGTVPAGPGIGSNNWVLAGEKTASGRPILANDPHLPPVFPTIWYENHLAGGRYSVTGFTSPGVPAVIIGHNEQIAWGVTNAFPDVQDLYVERFHPDDPLLYEVEGEWVRAEEEIETIHVRGRRRPVVEEVRYTRHGPIVSGLIPGDHPALALRWTCHGRNNHLRALTETCRAGDWAAFRRSLHDWAFPSQNLVYADVDGNVGYVMPGRVPVRARGEGLTPVPGWTTAYDWTGWIPFDELPARFNPAEGYIVTANNRITGDDYPYLLSGEWQPPYRARRIADLIAASAPLDLAANARIQNDTVSLMARRFLDRALPLVHDAPAVDHSLYALALRRLQQWDGDARPERVAPTIYFGWLVSFTRAAMAQALGADLAGELLGGEKLEQFPTNPFQEIGNELAVRWLEEEPPAWVGDVRPHLQPALQEALIVLQSEFGPDPAKWQWGKLHRLEIRSPLARIPGLGRLWRPVSHPVGGDGYSVNQAEVSPHFPPEPVHVIASCRMIVDVGRWDESLSALPGGQSAHPASEHYLDSVEEWLRGEYHPMLFSRARVEEAATGFLTLQPKKDGA